MRFEGTGAQILVECLRRANIRTIFGVPGDTGVAFYDALYACRDHIRHVLARDERSAAMMADAYARCTNTVGVVEASSGGGTTYVVGGLGEPFAASVPLLVITSDIHRTSRGTGALTEIDQLHLFSAVTKWAGAASRADEIPALVHQALAAATSGRPAPVSLVLPEDVLDERACVAIGDATSSVPRERPEADAAVVSEAATVLQQAQWPAIVAGSGIHLSQAWHELEVLADLACVPVATTIQGKGAISEQSPWSLGVIGANGARDYANEYLAAADVVLLVGTRANSTDTNGFTGPSRSGPRVIQIDVDADRAGRNFPSSTALVGDARTVLAQVIEALSKGDPGRRTRLQAWIDEHRRAWQGTATNTVAPDADPVVERPDSVAVETADTVHASPINPADIVRAIQHLAGTDVIVVADPGTPTPYVSAYWEIATAGRSVLIPRGHGPMGYAIPGAIGAALACPGRPVVALCGDGSFTMSCGELETACRLGLPIVYVQFTNGSFGWIKMLQHLYYDRRYFGVDLGPVDAVAVARGFGVQATRVDTLDDFIGAFKGYLAAPSATPAGPAFIDIVIPDETHVVPPVAPWRAALRGESIRPVY